MCISLRNHINLYGISVLQSNMKFTGRIPYLGFIQTKKEKSSQWKIVLGRYNFFPKEDTEKLSRYLKSPRSVDAERGPYLLTFDHAISLWSK